MIVVSDTSPISNLLLIDRLPLLPAVFGKVIVPAKVFEELLALEIHFGHDLQEIKTAPWLEIREVSDRAAVLHFQQFLDKGESEAIVLARDLRADFLLIDESEGRKIAQNVGLRIIGLLGVLMQAKRNGIIEAIKPVMDELRSKAGFRIAEPLYQHIIREIGE